MVFVCFFFLEKQNQRYHKHCHYIVVVAIDLLTIIKAQLHLNGCYCCFYANIVLYVYYERTAALNQYHKIDVCFHEIEA